MTIKDISEHDVTVVGAGSAGICAAIQSARAGARTLLLEKSGIAGGTTTTGGVNIPGLFHAPKGQVIAGIGWELVSECANLAGISMPDFASFDKQKHYKYQIPIDHAIYAALADEKLTQAGVQILFHSMPAEVYYDLDHNVWQMRICLKEGLKSIRTKILIDCTADANVVSLAGLPTIVPETVQPATLIYRVSGYDLTQIDMDLINQKFVEEVSCGNLKAMDAGWDENKIDLRRWLVSGGFNVPHIAGFNAKTSEEKSRLELEARASMLRLFRFLRKQPGLENIKIDFLAGECGVRESCVIVGETTITVDDYEKGRTWSDSLCYSYYPIDLHIINNGGLICKPLADNIVPTIPLQAMRPKNSRNLFVAGRCISSDRLANSALRTQASCMAMGQAVGMTAALSVQKNSDSDVINPKEIRDALKQQDAIVPE